MKWLPPNGSSQHSENKRYCVVEANSKQWVAYELAPTTGQELAVKPTAAEAKQACEDHEDFLIAARKRA